MNMGSDADISETHSCSNSVVSVVPHLYVSISSRPPRRRPQAGSGTEQKDREEGNVNINLAHSNDGGDTFLRNVGS
jgi:hypothetical protein